MFDAVQLAMKREFGSMGYTLISIQSGLCYHTSLAGVLCIRFT
jgi:hypothetical protein